jgi:hypothetical protein
MSEFDTQEAAIQRAIDVHRTRTGGHIEQVCDQSDEKIEADVRIIATILSASIPIEQTTCQCNCEESYMSRAGNIECCAWCDKPVQD